MGEKGGLDPSSPPQKSRNRHVTKPTPPHQSEDEALAHGPPPVALAPLEDIELPDYAEESPEMIRLPATPPQQGLQAPQTPPSPLGLQGSQGLQGPLSQQSQQSFQFAFKPVTPLRALKRGTKRQRPSSLTSQRGLENQDQLEGHLTIALTALEAAQQLRPSFTGLIQGVQRALATLASPQLPTQPPEPLSFAAALQKGLEQSQWNTVTKNKASQPKVQKAKPTKPAKQQAQKPKADPPQRQQQQQQQPRKPKPTEGLQLVLELEKANLAPNFSSYELKNKLNSAIGARVIQVINLSARGNLVLTTKAPYTAQQLLSDRPKWAPCLEGLTIKDAKEPASWVKLVAYGVPNDPSITSISETFSEEALLDNDLEVLGTPRWLKLPTSQQRTGLVLFAVANQAIAAKCKKQGLYIAGKKVTVSNFREFTGHTQCYRCLSYGHNPRTCRNKVRCAYCPEQHLTRDHSCTSCKASGPCTHYKPYCYNCKGTHRANEKAQCEVYRGIRNA